MESGAQVARIAGVLLAMGAGSCGFGTAGAVGAASGGGSGNATATVSGMRVEGAKEPPATIRFVLTDREGDPATVELLFAAPGEMLTPMTQLGGGAANPATLATSPSGMEHVFSWEYAAEAELPDDARFTDGVVVFASLGAGTAQVPGANSVLLGMGNDAPVVTAVFPPASEVSGTVGIELEVTDSSSDVVSIRVEYNAEPGFPDGAWQLARPALTAVTPEFGIQDVVANGARIAFFWNSEADVGSSFDGDVRVRFTPTDGLDEGAPAPSADFVVDNNAEPAVVLGGEGLVANGDRRRGIPVPVRVFDEEGDRVRLVLQWRRPAETFPVLPDDPVELEEILADPERRAELRIGTEFPTYVGGRAVPVGPTTVRLPELGSLGSRVLANEITTLELEILRAALLPSPLGLAARGADLVHPVAALPWKDGLTALVLDEPAGATWRLRELRLADGAAIRAIATGAGAPSAMALEPGKDAVLVASDLAGSWNVDRVTLADGLVEPLATPGPGVEQGTVRGIAALGRGVALVTVGSSLVRVGPTGTTTGSRIPSARTRPEVVSLSRDLVEPHGVVVDPLDRKRVLIAERGADRVTEIELDTMARNELVVRSAEFGTTLPRPGALAFGSPPSRLLVVTDAVPGDGKGELRAVDRGGAEGNRLFPLAELPDASGASVAVGADGLLLLALPGDDLAAGGGVVQRREIVAHEPSRHEVEVSEPFDPPIEPMARWRIPASGSSFAGGPDGKPALFVWHSAEVTGGGQVHVRVTPYDLERGASEETVVSKRVLHSLEETGSFSLLDPLVNFSRKVVQADLDRDGRLDMVELTGFDAELLRVHFQDALLAFDPPVTLEAPAQGRRRDFVVADLDGDLDLDLVATSAPGFLEPGHVEIFLQGAARFFPENPLVLDDPLLGRPEKLAAGDLDGDGDVDIVCTTIDPLTDTRGLALFIQDAPGTFAPPSFLAVEAIDLALGDLDGDADLDLVARCQEGIRIVVQTGPSSFEPTDQVLSSEPDFLSSVEASDMDGDGALDLLVSNSFFGLQVFLQTSPARFDLPPLELNPDRLFVSSVHDVTSADLDGDGDGDLVLASHEDLGRPRSFLNAYLQVAPGVFGPEPLELDPPMGSSPSTIDVGDVDGNGELDLLWGEQPFEQSGVRGLLQGSKGAVDPVPTLLGGPNVTQINGTVGAGDLDGDGDLDLVTANAVAENNGADNLSVFFQSSPGTFEPDPMIVGGEAVTFEFGRDVEPADVDGDGDLDLVTDDGDTLAIFEQTAPAVFTAEPVRLGDSDTTHQPGSISVADMNSDGGLDVVSVNYFTDNMTIFFQETSGTFDPSPLIFDPEDSSAVWAVVADADADGDLDLISADLTMPEEPDLVLIRLQTEQGAFAEPLVLEAFEDSFFAQVEAADLDGDGDLDLASTTDMTDDIALFFQRAPMDFERVILDPGFDEGTSFLSTGDVDGDGFTDLMTTTNFSNDISILRQSSPGTFGLSFAIETPGFCCPSFLRSLDIDGDGDADVASITILSEIAIYWGGR